MEIPTPKETITLIINWGIVALAFISYVIPIVAAVVAFLGAFFPEVPELNRAATIVACVLGFTAITTTLTHLAS